MGLEIGPRIKEIRLQKKLTQADVVGDYMTRNMLSKIENGNATPSVKTLEYLAKSLDVPISHFLDEAVKEPLNIKQLNTIEGLVQELVLPEENSKNAAIILSIQARARLAAGKTKEALNLFEGFDVSKWPLNALPYIYTALEDCHREQGNYRLAYEYALKRLGLVEGKLDNEIG